MFLRRTARHDFASTTQIPIESYVISSFIALCGDLFPNLTDPHIDPTYIIAPINASHLWHETRAV